MGLGSFTLVHIQGGVLGVFYNQLYIKYWIWVVQHPIVYGRGSLGFFSPYYIYTLGLGGSMSDYIWESILGGFYAQLNTGLYIG